MRRDPQGEMHFSVFFGPDVRNFEGVVGAKGVWGVLRAC